MRKNSKKIIIIASSLIVLIGLCLIIIMIIRQPESNPADKQKEQVGSQVNDNNIANENNLPNENNTSKDDNPSSADNEHEIADGSSFQVEDHIYQVLSSSQKTVALINTIQQSGDFIVPSEVTYNDYTYTVSEVGGSFKEIVMLDADENKYYFDYKGAFSDKEFRSITIPKSVTRIADYSFYGITNLQKVTINSDDIIIGKYAISYLSGLMFEERTFDINAKKVILEEGALSLALMTSININAEQLSVGDYALALAPKGIKLPQGTTSIGNYAFDGCIGTLTIPKNVSSIGEGAFFKMKLKIEEGNKHFKITDGILYNMEGTELIRAFDRSGSFTIPSNVTSIKQYAFAYSNITEITTSEHMKKIPDNAFYQCPKLTRVNLTEGIETIGDRAFFNNKSLESINLPQNITSLGTRTFYRTGISEVQIPASVTEIGKEAFGLYLGAESSNGVRITFEEGNAYYDQKNNIVYKKGTSYILMMILDPNLETILIPETAKEIGDINFINFRQEMQLVIPDTITTIDTKIFSYYVDPEDIGTVRFNGTEAPELKIDKDTKFSIYAFAPIVGKASYEEAFAAIPNKDIQTVRLNWY